MTSREPLFDQLLRASSNAPELQRAWRRRKGRELRKLLKVAALLLLATIVLPLVFVAAGILFYPKGLLGMLALPVAIIGSWVAILFFAYRPGRRLPRPVVTTELALLPTSTESWLEHERAALPRGARGPLDDIALRLEELTPALSGLDPQTPLAAEVRRLIGEELPELVRGYQKVPRELRSQPLHGGPSPDGRLIAGLTTIEREIRRLQERLATRDLHELAIQHRYLETKYKDSDEE